MRQKPVKSISVELDGRVCYIIVSFLGSTEGKSSPQLFEISPFKGKEFKSRLEWGLKPGVSEVPHQRSQGVVDVVCGFVSSKPSPNSKLIMFNFLFIFLFPSSLSSPCTSGGNYSICNIKGKLGSSKEIASPTSDHSMKSKVHHWATGVREAVFWGLPHSSGGIF